MLESAWYTIAIVAILATSGAVLTKDDALATILGIVGFISWAVWTFGSLNVVVITSSGTVVTYASPAATILGIAFTLLPGYIALTGPIEAMSRYRDGQMDDL